MYLYFLPLLAMVAGGVSLAREWGKRDRWFWVLVSLLLVTTAINIGLAHTERRESTSALAASKDREAKTAATLAAIKDVTSTTETRSSNIEDRTQAILELLRQYGYGPQKAGTATLVSVERSIEADRAFQAVLSTRRGVDSGVRVEYFPKDVDGAKVSAAMKNAGLDVVQKTALQAAATNAVWVGDSVPIEDARLVGLILLRAGVDLVAIRHFHDGGGPKARLIQVGADAALAGRAPLTAAQISALTLPPR